MADQMNNTTKYVVSNTVTSPAWQHTTVIAGDVSAQLVDLKAQPGKNLSVIGSATLVNYLLNQDLLDELTLLLHPLIVGDGSRPVFAASSARIPLLLVDASRFETDVIRLKYARSA
jgi:dihydrofolate reductase